MIAKECNRLAKETIVFPIIRSFLCCGSEYGGNQTINDYKLRYVHYHDRQGINRTTNLLPAFPPLNAMYMSFKISAVVRSLFASLFAE